MCCHGRAAAVRSTSGVVEGGMRREDVREALTHLNDNVRLVQSELARAQNDLQPARSVTEQANALRSALLEAIEVLRPPHRLAFGSLASRHYDVLTLRYVEAMSIDQICTELALGRRQVHRDLQEAEEKLADVLRLPRPTPVAKTPAAGDALEGELQALSPEPVPLALHEVITASVVLLGPLADRYSVRLDWPARPDPVAWVMADESVLKQVLVQQVSCAIQSAPGGEVHIRATKGADSATIRVTFRADGDALRAEQLAETQRIAEAQGLATGFSQRHGNTYEACLTVARSVPTVVLVVEDNPSTIELYRRYLPSGSYEVHSVSDPRRAVATAAAVRPDVIILDIMMPKTDGWSVLSTLTADGTTTAIPVIVCSVVHDPELAEALGAKACLRKPVAEAHLVETLRQVVTDAGMRSRRTQVPRI